jgi:hypothetical protein
MGNKPRSTATSVNGWHPTDAGDPTAVLDVDSTKLIRGFDFDRPALMSTTQPLRPLGEVTSEYVMARWPAYALNGDGECGSVCREEKDVMCMLYPDLCAHLRCQEFRWEGGAMVPSKLFARGLFHRFLHTCPHFCIWVAGGGRTV